jgi:hypothetical protein
MMESQQFDRIVKGLGQPTSRRTAAKALAIGGFGALLTRLTTSGAAAAACRRNGSPCQRNGLCCSGECHRDVCRRDRERERD